MPRIPALSAQATGTLIGSAAILLWAFLALLTDLAGDIPPFQLMAMAFAIAIVPGIVTMTATRTDPRSLARTPVVAWVVAVAGLFGNFLFYVIALQNAPVAEASPINYLWPLLLVLFTGLVPGGRWYWWHLAGAGLGLLGTIVLVTGGDGFTFRSEYLGGYASALACATIWAAYSVINRRFAHVRTEAVAGYCAVTALLAVPCHLATETTVWPQGWQWLAVIGLGLGPIGAAYYLWDHGTKHGDVRLLGTLSYTTPLLSTLVLVTFDRAEPTAAIGIACVLIVLGAVVASGRLSRSARVAARSLSAG